LADLEGGGENLRQACQNGTKRHVTPEAPWPVVLPQKENHRRGKEFLATVEQVSEIRDGLLRSL